MVSSGGIQLRVPLYSQIQHYIKEKIILNQLKEHDKIPSERELMEQFQVSRITVANALAILAKEGWLYRKPGRGSFVNEGVHELVRSETGNMQAEMKEPGTLQAAGRSLRAEAQQTPRRRMIGLVLPSMNDFFAIRLNRGICRVLNNSDYYVLIALTHNSKEKEEEAIRELIAMGAAGLLIFPIDAETYNDEILALKVRNYPFVLIDRNLPGVETHFVRSDSPAGAKLAVSHLWELGHREIAVCTDSPLSTITVEERISGYMEALKERGAMINPAHILSDLQIDSKRTDESNPLYRYMRSGLVTSYITLNARLGVKLYRLAKQIGLRVPEDVSIMTFDDPSSGYDDFEIFTHIAQSEEEMGMKAAEILLDLLKPALPILPKDYRKVTLRPNLVVRETTGPVRQPVR